MVISVRSSSFPGHEFLLLIATLQLCQQVNCCQSSKTEGLTMAWSYQSNSKLSTADRAALSRPVPFFLLKLMFIVMRKRSSTGLHRSHLRNREREIMRNSTSWLHFFFKRKKKKRHFKLSEPDLRLLTPWSQTVFKEPQRSRCFLTLLMSIIEY